MGSGAVDPRCGNAPVISDRAIWAAVRTAASETDFIGGLGGWTTRLDVIQLVQDRIEAQALNVLHDVVRQSIVLADAEHGHDVRVVQFGGGSRFTLKAPFLLGVLQGLIGQNLEGDMPAERDLLGLVNDPHAAVADLTNDAIIAELLEGDVPRAPRVSASGPSSRDSSATAMFSIIAIAGKTSLISAASSGYRSIYSLRDGRSPLR